MFLPFDHDIDPREPTLPHLSVLPWNRSTSWDNFTTIFKSWDVDTAGTGDLRSWYKRSTYRLFHNFVHSFKQPKLTRTLLAKWRAKSADKRPTLEWVSGSGGADSVRDSFCLGYPSDDDEDSCDDVVAIIGMLRDHFAVSDDKLTRSQQLRLKEEAFNDARSTKMEELTSTLRADSYGEDVKCSVEAVELSMQPYESMSLQDASEGFRKLTKGISLDETIADEILDDEERDSVGLPDNPAVGEDVIVHLSEVTELPKNFKLTDSQKECVDIMRKDMERGQMLVFVHGPPGSGKTTTARLLVSEKNLDLVFSGTTGTASSQFKAQTINSLLHMGRNVEDFQERQMRISPQVKSEIVSTFGDARILVIDEVSMLNPVMLALIDLRLRQCFDHEKHFGGLHVILMGDMFQFAPIGYKLKKPALYQAAVLCSRNRKLPNVAYRNGANLFMKFRLLQLKGQERADKAFESFLKPLRDTFRKRPITRSWVKKLRTLTASDIRQDPSWAFATVAVTGNDERLAITRAQVERFGWMRNEPVLQWVCPLRIRKVEPRSAEAKRKIAYTYNDLDIDPSLLKGKYSPLLGFFVRGASIVLSENLCTTLGYAKGTRGILESVVWDPEDGEVPDLGSLPRGVITTVKQPRFLLIRIKGKLIPIGTCHGKIKCKKKQRQSSKSKRKEVPPMTFRKHPVDLLLFVCRDLP